MSERPVSILDRDKPRPIVVEPDDTPEVILPIIVLIIFIVFIGWMLYLLISSGFRATSIEDPVRSDRRVSTIFTCLPGQCATDLQSGFKTCPVDNITPITIDPSQSVCNSRFLCDNPLTPFALQSDGSTNIDGVCEPNVECACLRVSQCANYILSIFTTRNGNAYVPLTGQRITFPQESTYVHSGDGIETNNPPIQFNDPSTTFCAAPLEWLPFSSPGCNFVSTAQANSMDYDDLVMCMGMVHACNNFAGDPCLQGTLAILSDNPDDLTRENIIHAQLACVRGEACPCDHVAIFDTNFGGVVCRQLP